MAYVTKVAKDRALWIMPSEAVAHVCGIERCKPTEAQDQILLALDDENIRTRWGNAFPVGYYKSGLAKFGGDSPRWGSEPYYWRDTIINWDEGTTYDPHIENENSSRQSEAKRAGKKSPKLLDELRPLLFLKRHVMKLWPMDNGRGEDVDTVSKRAGVPGRLTSQRPTITGDTSSNSPKPPSPPKLSKSAAAKAFKTWWAKSETEGGREPTSRACDKWATENTISRDWVRPWVAGLRTNKKGGRPAKPRS